MASSACTMSDVERLAHRLDPVCAGLDEADRDLLHAIFAWAGQAVRDEAVEVEGFDASATGGSLADTFGRGSQYIEIMRFSWGASNAATPAVQGGSAGKVDFSPFKVRP